MAELDRSLRELADEIDWPRAGGVVDAVGARLRGATPLRARRRPGRTLALAAALVLLLAGGAVAARLLFGGVEIVPTPTPPPASPAPPGAGLALGEPRTLAEARAAVPFRVGVPAALGAPDAVYVDATDERVTLAYRPRPGLPRAEETAVGALLDQFAARLPADDLLSKLTYDAEVVERVSVGRAPGLWIQGGHHVFFLGPDGEVRDETVRLAGNVLLWQVGDVTYRLEAQVPRDEAIRIAASMR